MLNKLHAGDCFEHLAKIPDGSVDLVLTDPPYGTTDNEWDKLPDFGKLFAEFRRILKPIGTVVLTCVFPFAAKLITDSSDLFKYNMVWKKSKNGFFQCKE